MSDTQSLLSSSRDNNTENTKRKLFRKSESNKFFRCCRCFGMKWTDDEYEQLDDDDDENNNNDKKKRSVKFLKLFRFTDQTDFILISIGFCAIVFSAVLMTINLVLLGKLMSTFTLESLNTTALFEQHNISIPTHPQN